MCTVGNNVGFIPAEILEGILLYLPADDVAECRLVNSHFNDVIACNYHFLPRCEYDVKFTAENGQLYVTHYKTGHAQQVKQTLEECDFSVWRTIEIHAIEFEGIRPSCSEESRKMASLLENVCRLLPTYRQHNVKSFSMVSVDLNEEHKQALNILYNAIIGSSTDLLFRDCNIPSAPTAEMIETLSVFDHYRWIDSRVVAGAADKDHNNSNDMVIRRFAKQMQHATTGSRGKPSYLAELNAATVASAADFVETWLNLEDPPFFNFSIHNCDLEWKHDFLAECISRKLSHYCYEFASRKKSSAHIKVLFVEDARICRIWPVFDVPARDPGHVICYARYFRDF